MWYVNKKRYLIQCQYSTVVHIEIGLDTFWSSVFVIFIGDADALQIDLFQWTKV